MASPRDDYEAPSLTEVGTVRSLTQGNQMSGSQDSFFGIVPLPGKHHDEHHGYHS